MHIGKVGDEKKRRAFRVVVASVGVNACFGFWSVFVCREATCECLLFSLSSFKPSALRRAVSWVDFWDLQAHGLGFWLSLEWDFHPISGAEWFFLWGWGFGIALAMQSGACVRGCVMRALALQTL